MAKKSSKIENSEENVFSFSTLQKELFKINPDSDLLADMPYKNILEYFGLGNYLLNAQISGSLFNGAPAGRVTILSGEPSSGKTFLSLNACREAQQKGYNIIWIDTENAMDRETMSKFGIDPSVNKVDYQPISTVEGIINLMGKLTSILKDAKRRKEKLPKILIVIDSLGNLSTEWELGIVKDGESGKVDMGHKQKLLKRLFRVCVVDCGILQIPVIVTNHVYSSMSLYGEPVISGGTGAFYNASTIITLSTAQLKDGIDAKTKTGIIVTSKIRKSRFTKAGIPIKFHISFYRGMNPYIGLEEYVDWETCGIAPGKILSDGTFEPAGKQFRTYAVKHLNKNIKPSEIWKPEIFTKEVLEALDLKLNKIFMLPDPTHESLEDIDNILFNENDDTEDETIE